MNATDIHAKFSKFTTEQVRYAALDLATRKSNPENEIALDMALFVLSTRLSYGAFNEICAEIEDMDVVVIDHEEFNSVSSKHHY